MILTQRSRSDEETRKSLGPLQYGNMKRERGGGMSTGISIREMGFENVNRMLVFASAGNYVLTFCVGNYSSA
jgi:hypothetical protein